MKKKLTHRKLMETGSYLTNWYLNILMSDKKSLHTILNYATVTALPGHRDVSLIHLNRFITLFNRTRFWILHGLKRDPNNG